MKSFTEFKNIIRTELENIIEDAEFSFTTVSKASGTYDGLTVKTDDTGVCPVLNLTSAYKQYENGTALDDIVDGLMNVLSEVKKPEIDKSFFFDYERAKYQIYPRLINTAANREYLSDKPHHDIEDLSIIYAVRVSENAQGFADAVITNDLADMWGVSCDKLNKQAMNNISDKPVLFKNIEEILFGDTFSKFDVVDIDEIDIRDYRIPFFILTNLQKTKGAVMAVSPSTMNRITARLGDVYVIPSSVDETLIVPKSEVDDVQELFSMVKAVNAAEVKPEDQLSNNIYEYDSNAETLVIAT